MKFEIGDEVYKLNGYPYEGEIVASFNTMAGKPRVVVDNGFGMLHIFNEEQICHRFPPVDDPMVLFICEMLDMTPKDVKILQEIMHAESISIS